MDDIISGEFSKNMMIDWDNDDVNLVTWRAQLKTNFEKTGSYYSHYF
jgi:ketol-acid reductoisomerase